MNSVFLIIIAVATAIVVSGQEPKTKAETDTQPIPLSSKVRGRVVYRDTGMPVRRAAIGLLDRNEYINDSPSNPVDTSQSIAAESFTLTNDNGEFEFRDVRPGVYYASVNLPNVLTPQNINEFFQNNSTVTFTKLDNYFEKIIVDGVSETYASVSVIRGASISGRVKFADREAATGVFVKVLRKGEPEDNDKWISIKSVTTDDRGVYRVVGLVPGAYYIKVTLPAIHGDNKTRDYGDSNFVRGSELVRYFPNSGSIEKAESIVTDWGQNVESADIALPDIKLFNVSGRVVAKETGKPIQGVRLNFQRISDEDDIDPLGGEDTNRTTSDLGGNWSFKDLPKGKYRLEATVALNCYFGCDDRNNLQFGDFVSEFELDDKDVSEVVVTMPPALTVAGTITIEGENTENWSINVAVYNEKQKLYRRAWVDDRRDSDQESRRRKQVGFRIGNLAAGRYWLRVRPSDGKFYVKSVRLNSIDLDTNQFEIGEQESIDKITIVLANDSGTLDGTVVSADGKSAWLKDVVLIPVDSERQRGRIGFFYGRTNSMGQFSVKAAPGRYFVALRDRKFESLPEDKLIEALIREAKEVTINPRARTVISLQLSGK
jgi:hypothetical protein